MKEIGQLAVVIHTFTDGTVECIINKENRGPALAYLSQAVCGAFDVAGEHEKEVRKTLCTMARQMADSILYENDEEEERTIQ